MDDDLDASPDDELYVLLDDAPIAESEPAPSLIAAARSLWPGRRTLRRVGALFLVAAAAAGTSAATTSWWDSSTARSAKAGTVSLELDSVTGGRPSTLSPAASAGIVRAEYVLEIADDGPVAVTVIGVEPDARPMLTTTAWHPLGTATIPAGGTGRVAVDVALDCSGRSGADPMTDDGGVNRFPDTLVTATTPNGTTRTVTLTSDSLGAGAPGGRGAELPNSPCPAVSTRPALSAADSRAPTFGQALRTSGRQNTHVYLAYDGVATTGTPSSAAFAMYFTATDRDPAPILIDTRLFGPIPITVTDAFGRLTVTPGRPVRFEVTVKLGFCDATTTDPQAILDTAAFVVVYGSDETDALPLAALVPDPGLRLARDLASQTAAVCP